MDSVAVFFFFFALYFSFFLPLSSSPPLKLDLYFHLLLITAHCLSIPIVFLDGCVVDPVATGSRRHWFLNGRHPLALCMAFNSNGDNGFSAVT